MLLFALTACGSNPQPDSTAQNTEEDSSAPGQEERTESQNSSDEEPQELVTSEAAEQNNILVAYFSQAGNTETIASQIAEHTGGELFHVETVTVYPDEYNDLIEAAHFSGTARPAFSLSCTVPRYPLLNSIHRPRRISPARTHCP
jgi:hypothetical protein